MHVLYDAVSGSRRISLSALARTLGVHRHTLRARMKEQGLSMSYDPITNDELDEIVRQYRQDHPDAGRGYTMGHIRSKYSLRIQRHRVVESMNRVDALGQSMRQHVAQKKKRQVYGVPRPNALWHIDGHHKLIVTIRPFSFPFSFLEYMFHNAQQAAHRLLFYIRPTYACFCYLPPYQTIALLLPHVYTHHRVLFVTI